MAKVTATDGNGNDVPVIQAQFNNRGEVESFLTQIGNHQKWVHAKDYHVEVDEAGDQPDITPGIMTKTATLKPAEVVKKDAELAPPVDPTEPAGPTQSTETTQGDGPLDPGIISEGDLDGPVPTAPILDLPPTEPEQPVEPVAPVTPPPAEPTVPPVKPAASNSTAKPKPVKPTKPTTK